MQFGLINKVVLTPTSIIDITDVKGLKSVCSSGGAIYTIIYSDKRYFDKHIRKEANK